jgi:hypothetical protein
MQYGTSAGYFSNSTGSSVTNYRLFPIVGPKKWVEEKSRI